MRARGATVVLVVLAVAGCSARDGDAVTDAGRDAVFIDMCGCADAGIDADATTFVDAHVDATTDAGRDAFIAPMDAAQDLGAHDAGLDAARTDAGTDAGPPDAGLDAEPPDLGPAPPNDTCTSAIDVTAGGTITGTTCGADDTLTLGTGGPGCATTVTPGTPDVFYTVSAGSGVSYRFVLTPGYAIQFVPSVCSGNGGCGPYPSTMDFTIGGSPPWYFAIEKSGGGCGTFSMTVSTF